MQAGWENCPGGRITTNDTTTLPSRQGLISLIFYSTETFGYPIYWASSVKGSVEKRKVKII